MEGAGEGILRFVLGSKVRLVSSSMVLGLSIGILEEMR